jgi:hypothetical protein
LAFGHTGIIGSSVEKSSIPLAGAKNNYEKVKIVVAIVVEICIIRNMEKNNKLTAAEINELDEFAGEHKNLYHANHEIADKVIDPKSPNFGKKGSSFMLMTGGVEQWYFKPKGGEDFFRVQWWQLDSNVGEGSYGQARYKGLNSHIFGKVGELFYTSKKWVFHFDGEKFNLNNPDSVTLIII